MSSTDTITVWTDYVLNWHASVPLSGDERIDAETARNAIMAARVDEYGEVVGAMPFDVARSHVTNHGTAIWSRIATAGV